MTRQDPSLTPGDMARWLEGILVLHRAGETPKYPPIVHNCIAETRLEDAQLVKCVDGGEIDAQCRVEPTAWDEMAQGITMSAAEPGEAVQVLIGGAPFTPPRVYAIPESQG